MANIHEIKEILTAAIESVLLQLVEEYKKENISESFNKYLDYYCENFDLDLPFVHFSLLEALIYNLINTSQLEAFEKKMPMTNLSQVFYKKIGIDSQETFVNILVARVDNLHMKNLFGTIKSTIDMENPDIRAALYEFIIHMLMHKLIDMKVKVLKIPNESVSGQDIWELNADLSQKLLAKYDYMSTNIINLESIPVLSVIEAGNEQADTPPTALDDSPQGHHQNNDNDVESVVEATFAAHEESIKSSKRKKLDQFENTIKKTLRRFFPKHENKPTLPPRAESKQQELVFPTRTPNFEPPTKVQIGMSVDTFRAILLFRPQDSLPGLTPDDIHNIGYLKLVDNENHVEFYVNEDTNKFDPTP